jgi:aspartate aminotransferase-like enzyme
MTDHPVLFIPGPVEVEPELREIMAMPLIGHRETRFKAVCQDVCRKLRDLFGTQQHAFFENAPATTLMEAGIRNLVGRRVLHLTCGAFSERWHKISAACGREPETLAVEWGQANLPETLAARLVAGDQPFEAVCITHCETSTGVLNPVRELAQVVREVAPDTLILVDTVTSLAGAEVRFDEWGIDLAFAGTQKCLALPPGLCVFALSERAVAKSATVPGRGFLLDFAAEPDRFGKGETPATPCVPLVFALDRQLDRIAAEGLTRRIARHRAMRDETLSWAAAHGVDPFVDARFRSPTVTTLRRGTQDLDALVARAKAAGFAIGKGYGKLKADTFRIGHMGDHPIDRLRRLLAALTPR